jgi:DinB superfamily
MSDQSDRDIHALLAALDDAERDATALVQELSEADASRHERPDSWSIAQCLDHIAKTNSVYLAAMQPPADRALQTGRGRRRSARPGLLGRWFVRTQEPPVGRLKVKAPKSIRPEESPSPAGAMQKFLESQNAIRAFIEGCAAIDLAGVSFPNPFVKGLRFSLATGLHVLVAHERRHLWQAWRIRTSAGAGTDSPEGQTAGLKTVPVR